MDLGSEIAVFDVYYNLGLGIAVFDLQRSTALPKSVILALKTQRSFSNIKTFLGLISQCVMPSHGQPESPW